MQKKLLSYKVFLAHILQGAVEKFFELDTEKIINLIEGDVRVSEVSLDPGETNKFMNPSEGRIRGASVESVEPDEGTIYYDIVFYVRMKDGISQIIINIEAQKNSSPGYPLMNRSLYYTCRLISSQKGRDFF